MPKTSNGEFITTGLRVLTDYAQAYPQGMTPKEITEFAQKQYGLTTNSKNPTATMQSRLSERVMNGYDVIGPVNGRFRLATDAEKLDYLHGEIEKITGSPHVKTSMAAIRASLLAALNGLGGHGREFEILIALLYKRMGYEVVLTPQSGDDNVDVWATMVMPDGIEIKMALEMKHRTDSLVDIGAAKTLYASKEDATYACLFTNGDFMLKTKNYAERKGILLFNGEKIVDMLIENGIGATAKSVEYIEFSGLPPLDEGTIIGFRENNLIKSADSA